MKKILTFGIIAVAILGLSGVVVLSARARVGNGFSSSLIQKLAERFNLNAEEVKEVFNEVREEMRQEMKVRFEERTGDKMLKFSPCFSELTDEQREALLNKKEELREKFEALKDLSLEERQVKMKEIREEMEARAKEQGIGSRCLGRFPCYGFGGRKGGFGRL